MKLVPPLHAASDVKMQEFKFINDSSLMLQLYSIESTSPFIQDLVQRHFVDVANEDGVYSKISRLGDDRENKQPQV